MKPIDWQNRREQRRIRRNDLKIMSSTGKNQKQAIINKQRRLRTSQDYLQKQRSWNRNNMKIRRQNEMCAENNRQHSRKTYARVRLTDSYRERRKSYARCSRTSEYREATPELCRQLCKNWTNTRALSSTSSAWLTEQQKYWLRRRRLLTVLKRRTTQLVMQQKMQSESGVSSFNDSIGVIY